MPDPGDQLRDEPFQVDLEGQPFNTEGATQDAADERPPAPSSRRAVAVWLIVALLFTAGGLAVILGGQRYYNPEGRIPSALSEGVPAGLYGIPRPLEGEYRALQLLAASGTVSVEAPVEYLPFPRTLADRLFGKRREDALIFTAYTVAANPFRVLALRENSETVLLAIESPGRFREDATPAGLFVGVPPGPTYDALQRAVADAERLSFRERRWETFTIFGPFERGDPGVLAARIAINPVLRHLAAALEDAGPVVSIAAPVFLVLEAPPDRTINALYQSSANVVLQPLWGDNATDSLAHELVHAYFDEVAPDRALLRLQAQAYLEAHQAHLLGNIVGDLYEQLHRPAQAEEAIAFLIGALAARQPTTVAPLRALENQGLVTRSAGLLSSDVEFLIGVGLLPACMEPGSLGHTSLRIDFAYFNKVDVACMP